MITANIKNTNDFGFVQFIPVIVAGLSAGAAGLEHLSSRKQSQAAIYQAQVAAQIAKQKAEAKEQEQKIIMYALIGGAVLFLLMKKK